MKAAPVLDRIKRVLDSDPVIIDTETTGFDARSEVVELCAIDREGKVLFDRLFCPIFPIPSKVTEITGITDEMCKNELSFQQCADEIIQLFRGRSVVIYNADFDTRLLIQTFGAYRIPFTWTTSSIFCMMKEYANYRGVPGRFPNSPKWHKLGEALDYHGIPWRGEAHRAQADCFATLDLMNHLISESAASPTPNGDFQLPSVFDKI